MKKNIYFRMTDEEFDSLVKRHKNRALIIWNREGRHFSIFPIDPEGGIEELFSLGIDDNATMHPLDVVDAILDAFAIGKERGRSEYARRNF